MFSCHRSLLAAVQQRHDGEPSGLADAALEVAHLHELVARRIVDRGIETVLAHHQDPLGAQRKLGMQAQITQEVSDDGALEPVAQRREVLAAGRIGKVAGRDGFEHFRVGIEAMSKPVCRPRARCARTRRSSTGGSTRMTASVASRGDPVRWLNAECSNTASANPGTNAASDGAPGALDERQAHHREDRRRAAVHDRRAESAHDPRAESAHSDASCR